MFSPSNLQDGPTPSTSKPQAPEDLLHSIDPGLANMIKGLIDSQVQQRVQQQAQEAEERASAKWKTQFDAEWDRQSAMYRQQLEEAQALRTTLEERLQASLGGQEAASQPAGQAASMMLPHQIPLPVSPRRQARALPSPSKPMPSRSKVRKQSSEAPTKSKHANASRRGRTTQRSQSYNNRARDRSRSASPLQQKGKSRMPPSPGAGYQANATAGPSRLTDHDIDMSDEEKEEEEEEEEQLEGAGKKRRRRKEFQLLTTDLPDDIRGLKDALMTHCHILLQQTSPKAIPKLPDLAATAAFNRRFESSAAVENHVQSKTLLVAVNEVRCAYAVANANPEQRNSKILRIVRQMSDHILLYIDTCLAQYGLTEWRPDWTQPPSYLYNSVHQIVALDTFKQAAVSHAYASLKPNLKYIHDMTLLVKLYNHIIYYHFKSRYTRELVKPGSVTREDRNNPAYQRRKRLCRARKEWLKEHGMKRYRKLIKNTSTSDDERDPEGRHVDGQPLYFIRSRPERSAAANRFFRLLDKARKANTERDPSRQWKERTRHDPPQPIPTEFPSIPTKMPADYFDADYFNSLAPGLRIKAAKKTVAFLDDVEQSFTYCVEEYVNEVEFTKAHSSRLDPYEFFEEDSEEASDDDSDSDGDDDA